MTPTDPEPYRTDVWDPEQVNPNSIGGGGKIHRATQHLVKSARVRTIIKPL